MQFRQISLLVCLLLSANISFAQDDELLADSMIKKFKVKTLRIISFYEPDTTMQSYEEILKYDTLGKIISEQLIDKDTSDNDDTGFDGEFYFYKGDKLVEKWNIGFRNPRTMKVDTEVIKYYYEDNNKLKKMTSNYSSGLLRSHVCLYEYKDNYELDQCYEDWFHYTDSLIYLKNGKLGFLFSKPIDCLYEYKYNIEGQVIQYRVLNISDTSLVSKIKLYYYTKGLLTKETEINSDPFETTKNVFFKERVNLYYYYEKGLLREVRRGDNVIMERYNYEYYH